MVPWGWRSPMVPWGCSRGTGLSFWKLPKCSTYILHLERRGHKGVRHDLETKQQNGTRGYMAVCCAVRGLLSVAVLCAGPGACVTLR